MKNLKKLQKNGEKMDYEHRSDCWYKNVCQEQLCDNCIRYMEMSHLLETSGIPKNKQIPIHLIPDDADYDVFCRLAEIKSNIKDIITDTEINLYLCSNNTGNGKTTWAIKLLLKYFDSIWAGNGFRVRGLFIHIPTLLSQFKDFQNPISEEFRYNLLNCDLVIFDDIAVTGISKYDYNNLITIIDYRILNGKSNIFTSNKTTKQELEYAIGSRLASRIWETSLIIQFVGKDRRNGQFTNYQ